jgi:hypothetical protein
MNIFFVVAIPVIILAVYYSLESLFLNVIITANTTEEKEKINSTDKDEKNTKPKKKDSSTTATFLRISTDVECAKMTVWYITAYLVFLYVVYLVSTFDANELRKLRKYVLNSGNSAGNSADDIQTS